MLLKLTETIRIRSEKLLSEAMIEKEKPTIIIGKTIMGKGLLDNDGKSFERKTSTHGMPVSEAGGSFEKSLVNLGGNH